MAKKRNFKSKLKNFRFKRKKETPEDVPFYVPEKTANKEKQSSKQPGVIGIPGRAFLLENRGKVHKTFLTLLIVSICWFTGRLAGLFLTPNDLKTSPGNVPTIAVDIETADQWQRYTQLIRNKDLFHTTRPDRGPMIKKEDEIIVCDEADSKSSLPLKLVNTVVLQDSIKSLASVQVRGNKDLQNIREGEKVEDLAEIFHIDRLYLILKNLKTGKCEFITHQQIEEENKIKSPELLSPTEFAEIKKDLSLEDDIKQIGNTICVSRTLINEKMADFNKILTEARAVQINNPDGSLAFKIVEITPGSIYTHLNIQNNDIIKSINGQPIAGLQAIMGLFGKIANLPKLNLEIEREGNLIPMKYEFSQNSPATCKE